MARICIVTPGQLGSNPRVVKEANALTDAGHRVRVVSTKVAAFVEPRDQEIMAEAKWRVDRVAFDDSTLWRRERLRQTAARALYSIRPSASVSAVAHSAMTRLLTESAMAEPADLYMAHYVAALPAAAAAAKRHSSAYAFDAEDFHLGDLPDSSEHDFDKSLIRSIEGRYLPGAAFVSAAAPGIAEAYEREYGIERPTVVLNVFPKAEGAASPTPRGWAEPGPSLYWFSQTIGADRGLECAVRAIGRAATRPHLYLRGTPAAGYESQIEDLAQEAGAAGRVHALSPGPPSQMVPLSAQYDLGLVGETGRTRNRRIALTNKQFTYLLAGVPAVMSDVPAHRDFASQTEGATFLYQTEDAASLAATLDVLLSDPDRLAAARREAHRLAHETFNWDQERKRLIELFASALEPAALASSNHK